MTGDLKVFEDDAKASLEVARQPQQRTEEREVVARLERLEDQMKRVMPPAPPPQQNAAAAAARQRRPPPPLPERRRGAAAAATGPLRASGRHRPRRRSTAAAVIGLAQRAAAAGGPVDPRLRQAAHPRQRGELQRRDHRLELGQLRLPRRLARDQGLRRRDGRRHAQLREARHGGDGAALDAEGEGPGGRAAAASWRSEPPHPASSLVTVVDLSGVSPARRRMSPMGRGWVAARRGPVAGCRRWAGCRGGVASGSRGVAHGSRMGRGLSRRCRAGVIFFQTGDGYQETGRMGGY